MSGTPYFTFTIEALTTATPSYNAPSVIRSGYHTDGNYLNQGGYATSGSYSTTEDNTQKDKVFRSPKSHNFKVNAFFVQRNVLTRGAYEIILELSTPGGRLEDAGWTALITPNNGTVLERRKAIVTVTNSYTRYEWRFLRDNDNYDGSAGGEPERIFNNGAEFLTDGTQTTWKFITLKSFTGVNEPVLIEKTTDVPVIQRTFPYNPVIKNGWFHTWSTAQGDDNYYNTIQIWTDNILRKEHSWEGNNTSDSPTTFTVGDTIYSRGTTSNVTNSSRGYGVITRVTNIANATNAVFDAKGPSLRAGSNGDFAAMNFDIKTAIYHAQPPNLVQYPSRTGFPKLGPRVVERTNCNVYFSCQPPVEVTDTSFTIPEWIIGDEAPTDLAAWQSALVGRKVRSLDGTFIAKITSASFGGSANTGRLLDFDLNGQIDALTDGLMLLRYLFGLRGSNLAEDAVAEDAVRTTGVEIGNYIGELIEHFDFDENGSSDALTDGLLLLRYAFGLRGVALVSDTLSDNSAEEYKLENDPDGSELTARMAYLIDGTASNMGVLVNLNSDNTYAGSFYDHNNPPTATGEPESVLGFQTLEGSVRDKPGKNTAGSTLYIEHPDGGYNHNNITTTTRSGNSGFRLDWSSDNKFVERIFTDSNDAPMALIEAGNEGHYGLRLEIGTLKNGAAASSTLFPTNFLIQGEVGGGSTIFDPIVASKANLPMVQKDDNINVTIQKIAASFIYSDDDIVYTPENCTVQVVSNTINDHKGTLELAIKPGLLGQRYSLGIDVPLYIVKNNVDPVFKASEDLSHINLGQTGLYSVKGVIKGVAKSTGSLISNTTWYNSNGLIQAPLVTKDLIGRDALGISCTIDTNLVDYEQAQLYAGRMITFGSSGLENCTIHNKVGPIKVRESFGKYDLFIDHPIIVPDDTGDFNSYSGKVVGNISRPEGIPDEIQDDTGYQWEIPFQGAYSPEYGIEVVNERGGTKLNSSNSPLRLVNTMSGTMNIDDGFVSDDVIEFKNKDSENFFKIQWSPGTGHNPYYGSYNWIIYSTARWNNIPVDTGDGTTKTTSATNLKSAERGIASYMTGTAGSASGTFQISGSYSMPNNANAPNSGNRTYPIKLSYNKVTYYYTFTNNRYIEVFDDMDATASSYGVINNEPESMCSLKIESGSNRFKIVPTNWDLELSMAARLHDTSGLNAKHALVVVKLT